MLLLNNFIYKSQNNSHLEIFKINYFKNLKNLNLKKLNKYKIKKIF